MSWQPLHRETTRISFGRRSRVDCERQRALLPLLCWLAAIAGPPRATARGELELPRRNPRARLIQQVGLTEITVEYSSLAVAGRPIWGTTVPEGRLWITGETPAARLGFNREVTIAGQKVPAGTYSLLLLPGRDASTFVINANPGLSETSTDYRPERDLARVTVRQESVPARERLTFLFSDFDGDGARLDLEWEKRRVSLPIEVNTRAQVLAGIAALDEAWRGYANAARYMLETRKDYAAGLDYVHKSLSLKETSYNDWILASLLAAQGRYTEARERAERAFAIAPGVRDASLSDLDIGRAMAEWGRSARRSASAPRTSTKTKTTTDATTNPTTPERSRAAFHSSEAPSRSVIVVHVEGEIERAHSGQGGGRGGGKEDEIDGSLKGRGKDGR